ncbi:MAG: hypothetical protein Q9203_004381 [Teloschistes exilis]
MLSSQHEPPQGNSLKQLSDDMNEGTGIILRPETRDESLAISGDINATPVPETPKFESMTNLLYAPLPFTMTQKEAYQRYKQAEADIEKEYPLKQEMERLRTNRLNEHDIKKWGPLIRTQEIARNVALDMLKADQKRAHKAKYEQYFKELIEEKKKIEERFWEAHGGKPQQ